MYAMKDVVRFLSKVDTSGKCWEWQGSKRNGYGQLSRKGKSLSTHRYSWRVFRGNIPSKMFVLHRCDNPICVRPDHLFLGTHKDNMRDMHKKGRANNPPPPMEVGERHSQAKLKNDDVLAIRRRYADGETMQELGDYYGVVFQHIFKIIKRQTWKHI